MDSNDNTPAAVAQVFDSETQKKIEKGVAAWKRIKSSRTWSDWLAIGEAIEAAQNALMAQYGFNNNAGAKWNAVWTPWLAETGFDQIHPSTRSVLAKCIKHRDEIDKWRALQNDDTRARLNHPVLLWRCFEKPEHNDKKPSAQSRQRDETLRLQQEVDDLTDKTIWTTYDTPEDAAEHLATVLIDNFPDRETARAILAELPGRVERLFRQREPKALPVLMFDQPQP